MVIGNLGTVAGKIKIVIADAGLFAYENIFVSPNFRIIPVIKKRSNVKMERIEEKLRDAVYIYLTLFAVCRLCPEAGMGVHRVNHVEYGTAISLPASQRTYRGCL